MQLVDDVFSGYSYTTSTLYIGACHNPWARLETHFLTNQDKIELQRILNTAYMGKQGFIHWIQKPY